MKTLLLSLCLIVSTNLYAEFDLGSFNDPGTELPAFGSDDLGLASFDSNLGIDLGSLDDLLTGDPLATTNPVFGSIGTITTPQDLETQLANILANPSTSGYQAPTDVNARRVLAMNLTNYIACITESACQDSANTQDSCTRDCINKAKAATISSLLAEVLPIIEAQRQQQEQQELALLLPLLSGNQENGDNGLGALLPLLLSSSGSGALGGLGAAGLGLPVY